MGRAARGANLSPCQTLGSKTRSGRAREGAEVGQEDEAELLEAEVEVDVVSNDEGSEEDAQVKIDEVLSDTETAQHTSRKGRKHKQRK